MKIVLRVFIAATFPIWALPYLMWSIAGDVMEYWE